jgi:hypothetical protein
MTELSENDIYNRAAECLARALEAETNNIEARCIKYALIYLELIEEQPKPIRFNFNR